ncbi:MAG: allantoinase AllB [Chloroflexota bacterium]
MTADLYLKNGLIVTEESEFNGGIVVSGGKIQQLVAGEVDIAADEIIDVAGKVVLPGIVDAHVHLNEPGRTHWEGYRTGTMAAAVGGITTVIEMPLNAAPPTIDKAKLALKRDAVKGEAVVDHAQWGGLVDNNLTDLADLHAGGVVGFKAFMTYVEEEFRRVDDDLIFAGMQQAKALGNLVGIHCENQYVTQFLSKKLQAEGRTDLAAWPEARPPHTELEAIQRAIYWAKVTGAQLHVVHVTIPEGIQAVVQAKADGINVTAETCPQYLLFDVDDYLRIGPTAKCAPPIRTRETVEAMWELVLAEKIDLIASDHSPCPSEDKAADNIWEVWGGISGLQTMLAGIVTEGVHKRGMTWSQIAKLMAANPARIFGLYPQKGALLPDSDADLTIIDPDKVWTLTQDQLFYRNKHSPFIDYTYTGSVTQTILRGKTVFHDGNIMVEPGFGQVLQRQHKSEAVI